MNDKTTYYLRFVIMLLMSIVVNCGYACGYLSYRDLSGRRLTEPEYHFYQRDRFYCPDDLAHNYHPISPYAYCANNPIINIDEHGDSMAVFL